MNMETIGWLATYVTAAIGYAVSSYMLKVRKNPDVEFDPVRFGSTVAVGALAGVIMAFQGDEITEEAYIMASGVAMIIFDKVVNFVQDTRRDGGGGATEPTNDAGATTPATESETKYR